MKSPASAIDGMQDWIAALEQLRSAIRAIRTRGNADLAAACDAVEAAIDERIVAYRREIATTAWLHDTVRQILELHRPPRAAAG